MCASTYDFSGMSGLIMLTAVLVQKSYNIVSNQISSTDGIATTDRTTKVARFLLILKQEYNARHVPY